MSFEAINSGVQPLLVALRSLRTRLQGLLEKQEEPFRNFRMGAQVMEKLGNGGLRRSMTRMNAIHDVTRVIRSRGPDAPTTPDDDPIEERPDSLPPENRFGHPMRSPDNLKTEEEQN